MDDFTGLANGTKPIFGNWTGVNGSDGTNGWVVLTGATGSAGTGPSATTGTTPYVYLESSASSQTYGVDVTLNSTQYIESNVLDADAYGVLTFDMDYHMWGMAADGCLHVDAWDGSTWVDVNGGAINCGNAINADQWNAAPTMDLSSYSNSDFKLRVRFEVSSTGNVFANDVAVDNLRIQGQSALYNGPSCTGISTTGWLAGTKNLEITYTDSCGTTGLVANGSFSYVTDVTPPSSIGTVTITSPASGTGTYIPPTGLVFTAQVTEPESTPTCQYTTNGTAWVAGTISGASSPYTCTASPAGPLPNGAASLNIRASSAGGGPTTGTALSRTVDATGPTDGALTVTPGNTQLVLNWTAATDAGIGLAPTNTYKVVRATGGTAPADCTGAAIYQGTALTYTNTGLTNGTQYSYRVCAYDTYGNVSSGATASATPSACTETASVTIREPIPNPISSTLNIYADLGGTNGSTPQVATAPGGPWTGSPLSYVPPVNSSGAVTFYAQATGFCGTITDPTPVATTYDTRLGTVAGTATASPGDEKINVSADYSADGNTNNTLVIKWVLAGGNFTTPLGTQNLPHAASPYASEIPGLTNGTAYDVQVTYQDADGFISGSAVQVILNVIPQNKLMHNSRVTGSSKWPIATSGKTVDGWGITNAKYGRFTCDTCHEKNASPNIKRIKKTITAPDANPTDFPGSAQTVTLTTTDQAANPGFIGFGNDAGGHATSNKVCEVCHTITSYHRYNTTVDPDGAGPLTAQSTLTHYNNADCVTCHKHSEGFKAGCDACHGNPPIVNTLGGPNGLANVPSTSGSATSGKHVAHVTTQGYGDCNTCHTGWLNSNQMPDSTTPGRINVGFALTRGAAQSIYDGRVPSATNKGYIVDTGSTVNIVAPADLTCAVYCHGSSIGGPTLANAANPAKWVDTAPWGACSTGACHGTTAASPPANPASGMSHTTHAGTAGRVNLYTGAPLGCSACHGAGYTAGSAAPAGHVSGTTQFNVTTLLQDYRAATAARYNGLASGSSAGYAPTATASYGTCNNLSCHWNTVTPKWNNGGALTCTSCHNNGTNDGLLVNAAPASGSHAVHVTANAIYVTCDSCHGNNANTGTHTGHVNNLTNFAGQLTPGGNFTDVGGRANTADTCAVNCHKDATWGGVINWSGGIVDACTDCHSNTYAGKAGPTVVFNPTTTPSGSHLKALKTDTLPTTVANWKTQCNKCHTKHSGTVVVDLPPTSWDNPGTAATETTNMRTQLGINYVGAGHGSIKLGGASTSGTNEASVCWNCHDAAANTVSEWGYNTDTNSGTFPVVTIADRDGGSTGSQHYGWTYTTQAARDANTVASRTSQWVNASGAGYWHRDGYSPEPILQRQIKSVHSVNFTPANQSSSVGTTVNTTTGVVTHVAQETPANIRCSYCHDVHDLNLAVNDANTGKPFLRGSWTGNPYPPDMPPYAGYTYPSTGGADNVGNRMTWTGATWNAADATPRLYVSTSRNKGGYFLDQNSNWPTKNASYDTLAETAGVCTMCHGTDVNNMDFYPNSTAATKLWRTDQVNGHANSALGGGGAGNANARNIFDGKRGATNYIFMAFQDNVTPTLVGSWGKNSRDGITPQDTAPYSQFSQPGDTGAGTTRMPGRVSGWFGGTEGLKYASIAAFTAAVPQFATWYNGSTTATTTAAIGTDGSSGATRAHSFTCSKCHTPHASGLPALLITNCLDFQTSSWVGGNRTAIRSKATNAFVLRTQNNCHRKEGTTTGWTRLGVSQ